MSGMKTIRTFIAIPLVDGVKQEAIHLIQRLKHPSDGIKWVPTDNLHLTLKFLGEVDNTEVPRVCDVLEDACEDIAPFELQFAGTGALPSLQRPRVLFAGIRDDSGQLTEIVAELERDYADLGFKPESRDYTPHLTLGRVKGGRGRASEEVITRLEAEQDLQLGNMMVDTIQVIASFLDKHGPTYQVMGTIEL